MSPDFIESACAVMHDAYEKAAPKNGWSSQVGPKPWSEVPESNKETMRAAVGALLEWLTSNQEIQVPR